MNVLQRMATGLQSWFRGLTSRRSAHRRVTVLSTEHRSSLELVDRLLGTAVGPFNPLQPSTELGTKLRGASEGAMESDGAPPETLDALYLVPGARRTRRFPWSFH